MKILIDIGGTKIRIGYSQKKDEIEKYLVLENPLDYNQTLALIKSQTANFPQKEVDCVVVGLPGVLNQTAKVLLKAPNLTGWEGINLFSDFESLFGCRVILANDADLAGLGEAIYGAGRESEIVAYLTISTGIGGTRVVGKKLDKKALAFEPGHQIVDYKDYRDLENFASGSGLEKKYNTGPKNITDQKIWDSVTNYLAVAVYNTIVYWSPDIVVIGGGLLKSEFLSLENIESRLTSINKFLPILPGIVQSQLGDTAALLGGLRLAQETLG